MACPVEPVHPTGNRFRGTRATWYGSTCGAILGFTIALAVETRDEAHLAQQILARVADEGDLGLLRTHPLGEHRSSCSCFGSQSTRDSVIHRRLVADPKECPASLG